MNLRKNGIIGNLAARPLREEAERKHPVHVVQSQVPVKRTSAGTTSAGTDCAGDRYENCIGNACFSGGRIP
jgi:hypothetical protein